MQRPETKAIRLQILLTGKEKRMLKREATVTHQSMGEVLRKALSEYFERRPE